jgi:hypothetical protein
MNTEWIKKATNEELVAELENTMQHLNNAQIFSKEHREYFNEIKLIKEEILNRMK